MAGDVAESVPQFETAWHYDISHFNTTACGNETTESASGAKGDESHYATRLFHQSREMLLGMRIGWDAVNCRFEAQALDLAEERAFVDAEFVRGLEFVSAITAQSIGDEDPLHLLKRGSRLRRTGF